MKAKYNSWRNRCLLFYIYTYVFCTDCADILC